MPVLHRMRTRQVQKELGALQVSLQDSVEAAVSAAMSAALPQLVQQAAQYASPSPHVPAQRLLPPLTPATGAPPEARSSDINDLEA